MVITILLFSAFLKKRIRKIKTVDTCLHPKTLDIRRLCTDRRQDAAVIFLFGLDALFIRDSRAHSSVVLSLPQLLAALGSYSDLTSCYWLL
jgi:hypothetical protein